MKLLFSGSCCCFGSKWFQLRVLLFRKVVVTSFSFDDFVAVVLIVHAIVVVGAAIQLFVSLLQQHKNIKQTFHVNNIKSCPMKAFIMQKNKSRHSSPEYTLPWRTLPLICQLPSLSLLSCLFCSVLQEIGAAVDEVAVLWKLLLFWKQMVLVEGAAVSEGSCDIFFF